MENMKGYQSEMKTAISEIKSTLDRINRMDKTEDWISEIEDGVAEETQWEQQ